MNTTLQYHKYHNIVILLLGTKPGSRWFQVSLHPYRVLFYLLPRVLLYINPSSSQPAVCGQQIRSRASTRPPPSTVVAFVPLLLRAKRYFARGLMCKIAEVRQFFVCGKNLLTGHRIPSKGSILVETVSGGLSISQQSSRGCNRGINTDVPTGISTATPSDMPTTAYPSMETSSACMSTETYIYHAHMDAHGHVHGHVRRDVPGSPMDIYIGTR